MAGYTFQLLCSANILNGIRSTPIFSWHDSDGGNILSTTDISVGPQLATTLPLEFNLLRVSDSGMYTCNVTLFSLALQQPLTISASINVDVQCKYCTIKVNRGVISIKYMPSS